MSSREGATGLLALAAGISLFNIGFQLGNVLGRHTENTDSRIRDVQAFNTQVYEQLQPDYNGLGRLVLNDETDTFEFQVTPEGRKSQTCEGDYQVTDGIAKVTGNIACTTTVKVGGN